MKKIILFAVVLAVMLSVSACSKNPRCTIDVAKELMDAEETVLAYDYENEKAYEIDSHVAKEMLSGEWTEASRKDGAKKILSFTVGEQYELCFFEDGGAMIYSGLANIFEKDRSYFVVKTDVSLEDMCKAIRESGNEVSLEDGGNLPAAE